MPLCVLLAASLGRQQCQRDCFGVINTLDARRGSAQVANEQCLVFIPLMNPCISVDNNNLEGAVGKFRSKNWRLHVVGECLCLLGGG
jgi:hypothetical protein